MIHFDGSIAALARSADSVSKVSNAELVVPRSPRPEELESVEARWLDLSETLVRVAAATGVGQEATVSG